jgi:hypothetical protein
MARFSGLRSWGKRIKKSRQLKKIRKAQDRELLRARMKMRAKREIQGMGLYGKATAIIKKFNLPSTRKGRSILTGELQKTFFESLKKDKDKLTGKEKKCLELVEKLQLIRLVLWEHQRTSQNIPIKIALTANRLAVEIVKRAEKTVAKGNSELKMHFRNIRAIAEERAKELSLLQEKEKKLVLKKIKRGKVQTLNF